MNIKIEETLYPASIVTKYEDKEWGKRVSKAITLEMDYATAANLFVDEASWSIVQDDYVPDLETGEPVRLAVETDMSDYCVAGTITDNRDGTVTVKMGKPTEAELLAVIMGGKNV